MKKINSKNGSAAKKLIPAAGMLGISAVMLGTSTFAWFTMSRQVDVTGIQMTASVPSNIQISLGNSMFNNTGETWAALGATTNTTEGSATYRLTGVTVPGAADADPDWTNTVAISDYYAFGKLTPATSISGANLYFTKAATGVGRNIRMNGNAIDNTQFTLANDSNGYLSSSVAVCSAKASGSASNIYDNGGGYYIDIPVWFRTSSTTDIELAVKATIAPGSSTKGTRSDATAYDLFKAARVSVIQGAASVASTGKSDTEEATLNSTDIAKITQGVIYDGTSSSYTIGESSKALQSKYYSEDSNYSAGRLPENASGAYTYDGTENAGWKAVTKVTEATISSGFISNANAATTVAVVKAASGNTKNYGLPCRYTIRVWIDGEDVNCWNATAAQDFNIELNFIDKAYTS